MDHHIWRTGQYHQTVQCAVEQELCEHIYNVYIKHTCI